MYKPLPPLLTSLFRTEPVADATRVLLAPLVGHVASQERTIRRQAETIGSLRAELVAARAQITVLNMPPSAPEPLPDPRPTRSLTAGRAGSFPYRRGWRSWVAAGIMLAVMGPPPYDASAPAERRRVPSVSVAR